MAVIKRITSKAVHWRLPGNNPTNAANEALKQLGLSDDILKRLALLRINGVNYEWIHPQGGWTALVNAGANRAQVMDLLAKTRTQILSQGGKDGGNVIKVPNDDEYIFYKIDPAGGIQILITGWGFENSKVGPVGPGRLDPPGKPQNVRVGFTIDGQLIPNRPFTLSFGDQAQKETGRDGLYTVGILKTGTILEVTDIVTGRKFSLEVKFGVEEYLNDVTEQSKIEVRLLRDGKPTTSTETVTVTYHGNTQTITANPAQTLSVAVVYWPGESFTVSAMGADESQSINPGVNSVTLNVDTPPAGVRVQMRHSDGSPYVSERIDINYGGNITTLVTNGAGEVQMSLPYQQGKVCRVTTSLGTEERELKSSYEELFDFREEKPVELKAKVRVRVINEDGSPISGETVTLNYNADNYDLVTDPMGECYVEMPYAQGRMCTVTTKVGSDQRIINDVTNEEVFVIKKIEDKPLEAQVLVRMQHADGAPMTNESVNISYGGNTLTLITDFNGEARTTLPYAKGRTCTVTTSIGAEQRELSAVQEEVFEFVELVAPKNFDYNIRFIDKDEKPMKNVKVVFNQDQKQWPVTLDDDGRTVLPNGLFQVGKPIDVVMHCEDYKIEDIKFELDPTEFEYVLQITPKEGSSAWVFGLIGAVLVGGLLSLGACALTDWGCSVLDPIVYNLLH